MERVALVAEKRESGKGPARRLRNENKIPAVLYGKVEPMNISVDRKALEKATKTSSGMNVLIDLSITGGDSGLALIRDYQADPFRRDFTHVDFQAITMSDKLDVEVPIILKGTPLGVKEGGIVEHLRRSLHIRALANKIPDKIEVDISHLQISDSIHADELALPEGVEFVHAKNYTIVAVVPPAKIEEAAPVAAAVVEGAAPAGGEAAAAGAAAGAADAKASPAEAKGKAEAKPKA